MGGDGDGQDELGMLNLTDLLNLTSHAECVQVCDAGFQAHTAHDQPHSVLLITVALALGALAKVYLHRTRIPYTILMFVVGILLGVLGIYWQPWEEYLGMKDLEPHFIFFIFLPVLIFESAFYCDVRVWEKLFWQSVILAGPGLIVATALTACGSRLIYPDWPWLGAFLFGSIISATDPVAVVGLLRDLGCSKKIATLIEGESLLNDGTAIVLYSVLSGAVAAGGHFEDGAGIILLNFIKTVALGVVTGLVIGWLTVNVLRKLFNDPVVEITLTVVAAYLTFYIAEGLLHSSGVLALVTLGVFLGEHKSSISPEVEHAMHEFWEVMVFMANTLIFILLGLIVLERGRHQEIVWQDFLWAIVVFLGVNLIRFIVVFASYPFIACFKHRLTMAEAMLVSFGGLRGAVGVVLALSVASDAAIKHHFGSYGAKVAFQVAGVCVGTLLINGILCQPLIARLKLDEIPDNRRLQVREAFNSLLLAQETTMSMLKHDRFLVHCNWDWVRRLSFDGLEDPYSGTKDLSHLEANTEEEALVAYYKAFRSSVQKNFEEGLITPWVHRTLINLADEAAEAGGFIDSRFFHKVMRIPMWLNVLWKIKPCHFFLRDFMFHRVHRVVLLAFGFFYGQEDIIRHREDFVVGHAQEDAEQIIKSIGSHACELRAEVLRDIQLLRQRFPEVLMAVKTRVAAREILNHGRKQIHKLKKEGSMDNDDAEILIRMVENRMKAMQQKCPYWLGQQSGHDMLRHTDLWSMANAKVQQKLISAARHDTREKNQAVYQAGDEASVHLVVDGIVVRILHTGQKDYIGPGQWLGLNPTLTGSLHGNDVVCETTVTLISIAANVFQECLSLSPQLDRHVWVVCGREWCARLLRKISPYSTWSHFKRARWLLNGDLLDLIQAGDHQHVAKIQYTSIKVKLHAGHTYVLIHGTAKAEIRRRTFANAGSDMLMKVRENSHIPQPPRLDTSTRLEASTSSAIHHQPSSVFSDLDGSVSGITSPANLIRDPKRFTGPCLLPPHLKVVTITPESKIFHIPPPDGLFSDDAGPADDEDNLDVKLHHDERMFLNVPNDKRDRDHSARNSRSDDERGASPISMIEGALPVDLHIPMTKESSKKLGIEEVADKKDPKMDVFSPLVMMRNAVPWGKRKKSKSHIEDVPAPQELKRCDTDVSSEGEAVSDHSSVASVASQENGNSVAPQVRLGPPSLEPESGASFRSTDRTRSELTPHTKLVNELWNASGSVPELFPDDNSRNENSTGDTHSKSELPRTTTTLTEHDMQPTGSSLSSSMPRVQRENERAYVETGEAADEDAEIGEIGKIHVIVPPPMPDDEGLHYDRGMSASHSFKI